MRRVGIEFRGMRLVQFQHVARKFNGGNLHAQAQAQVGHLVLARIFRAWILPSMPRSPNPPGTRMPPRPFNILSAPSRFDHLGLDLLDFHPAIVGHPAVDDGLIDRLVGVVELDVFAHHADAHAVLRGDEFADDLLPVRHVGHGRVQMQQPADQFVHPLALQHQRHFVNAVVHVLFLDDRLEGTLQNMEIFWRKSLSSGRSQRQTRMCGVMPISRSLATDCCVGLVLSSPAALMNGT
jgi:hypothetical protein